MVGSHEIWAKSRTDGAVRGESLVEHTLQVVRRIAQLRERAPFLPLLCHDCRLWHRLGLIAAIHDLGKGDPRFQRFLRESNPEKGKAMYGHRHEVLSLAWLDWILGHDLHQDRFAVSAAIASHHRDHSLIKMRYTTGEEWDPAPNIPDFVAPIPNSTYSEIADLFLDEILPQIHEYGLLDEAWVPPNRWNSSLDDSSLVIESLRRNLTIWEEWMEDAGKPSFEVNQRVHGLFLRGVIIMADHAASAGVEFASLPILSNVTDLSSRVAPTKGRSYFSHQNEAANVVGHAIMVAPTGSGKTEAALRWAARQYESISGDPPLFYVLPFKASMNAMRTRIVDRLTPHRAGGPSRPELVALQHSSSVQVLYHQLMSDESDRTTKQAAFLVNRQRSLAKLHATPIRVLSPYQLLRAAYQLKGHEAIWTDASGGVFILDEIHAYDPKRIARILEMLRFLVDRLGAKVLVMTATMPSIIRDQLVDILKRPAIVHATDETFDQFRRHRLQLRDHGLLDDSVVQEIATRVHQGEAVLCVATTVLRAQSLQTILRSLLGNGTKVSLLHSRFTGEDRNAKEELLRKLVSTEQGGKRNEQVVLVATQVVEVSLDVDFDVLFSDPAPMEALVQRFGRVNRSRRPEPRDVVVCTRIADSRPVYDEALVTAAIKHLHAFSGTIIDERDVQNWLDIIYDGSLGRRLAKHIDDEAAKFRKILSSLKPFETNDDLETLFFSEFDGTEVLPVSLVKEYRERLESEPLAAALLTVPISYGQLKVLWGKSLVTRPEKFHLPRRAPLVVDVHYDNESGLALNPPPSEEST